MTAPLHQDRWVFDPQQKLPAPSADGAVSFDADMSTIASYQLIYPGGQPYTYPDEPVGQVVLGVDGNAGDTPDRVLPIPAAWAGQGALEYSVGSGPQAVPVPNAKAMVRLDAFVWTDQEAAAVSRGSGDQASGVWTWQNDYNFVQNYPAAFDGYAYHYGTDWLDPATREAAITALFPHDWVCVPIAAQVVTTVDGTARYTNGQAFSGEFTRSISHLRYAWLVVGGIVTPTRTAFPLRYKARDDGLVSGVFMAHPTSVQRSICCRGYR